MNAVGHLEFPYIDSHPASLDSSFMVMRFQLSNNPTSQINALISGSGDLGLKTTVEACDPAVPILQSYGFSIVRRTLTGTVRPKTASAMPLDEMATDVSISDMGSATDRQFNEWLALHFDHYSRTHDDEATGRIKHRPVRDIFAGADYRANAAFALWNSDRLAAFSSLRQNADASWDFGWFGTAEHVDLPLRKMFNLALKNHELAYAREAGIETLWVEFDDTNADARDIMEALAFESEATYLTMVRRPDQL